MARRLGDGERREQARLDGRPNALTALGVGEPGGIADQQRAVADQRARRLRVEQVGMPARLGPEVGRNLAARGEPAQELAEVLSELAVALATEADVDEISFAKHPAVA